jgi:hypothetical protein
MDQTNFHAIVNLEEALKTYIDRNKKYGNNYKRFGHVMVALFPDGLTLSSVDDFNRYGVIFMKIAKLSRYVTNPKVGHQDSVHDDIVYSAMLEELDAEIAGLYVEPPVKLVTTVKPDYSGQWLAEVEVKPLSECCRIPVTDLSSTHHLPGDVVMSRADREYAAEFEDTEARHAEEPPIGSSTTEIPAAINPIFEQALRPYRPTNAVPLGKDLG